MGGKYFSFIFGSYCDLSCTLDISFVNEMVSYPTKEEEREVEME